MQDNKILRSSILMNIIILTLQYLAILWVFTSLNNLKSIFMSMNVELPKVTTISLMIFELLSGPTAWIVALLFISIAIVACILTFKTQKLFLFIPVINALQMAGYLVAFIFIFSSISPLFTLVVSGA